VILTYIYNIYRNIYIIFLSTQRYLDRVSWFHRLRRSRFYSTTVYHTHCLSLSVSSFAYCLTLTHTLAYCLTLWLVFALVLYIPKNGTTFQNCRLIATYHLNESHRPTSFWASTVFPAVVFVLNANTCSCAWVSLITRLWYMPPLIIPFFYITLGHPALISASDIYQLLQLFLQLQVAQSFVI
jgi:hypothetical protein